MVTIRNAHIYNMIFIVHIRFWAGLLQEIILQTISGSLRNFHSQWFLSLPFKNGLPFWNRQKRVINEKLSGCWSWWWQLPLLVNGLWENRWVVSYLLCSPSSGPRSINIFRTTSHISEIFHRSTLLSGLLCPAFIDCMHESIGVKVEQSIVVINC